MPTHLLAFAAHPDDLEFAVGAVLAKEVQAGRPVHMVICSKGEAGTNGTPDGRMKESENAARILGAWLTFLDLEGDAHLGIKTAHALALARLIRIHKPAILLAPSTVQNQHPDHWRLGTLVRDAARLARYGGVEELRSHPPHAVLALFYYALSPDAEPRDISPVLIDVSDPGILDTWTAAMNAHASQLKTRNYPDLQLTRARLNGLRVGGAVTHAIPLFPADPLVFESLATLNRSARAF
jgi:LmbE family N-acetylglucosaminyl deacetylase